MIRLVHLTDPHLSDPSEGNYTQRRLKRFFGHQSWRTKRRFIHRSEILDLLLQAVRLEQPDQILLTGDLVQIGLPQEIAAAGEWLRQLGPPDKVSLVLGNHDVYAADSWPAIARHWLPYLGLELDQSQQEHYPVARELIDEGACVRIVGLCSSIPTRLFMASGRLGAQQLKRYAQKGNVAEAFECVLIHHPPLPGMSRWRKGLHDAQALADLWRERPPAIVVHGHVHKNASHLLTNSPTRVFATASASSSDAHHPASFRVFDINRDTGAWQVNMMLKQLNPLSGRFEVVAQSQWSVA